MDARVPRAEGARKAGARTVGAICRVLVRVSVGLLSVPRGARRVQYIGSAPRSFASQAPARRTLSCSLSFSLVWAPSLVLPTPPCLFPTPSVRSVKFPLAAHSVTTLPRPCHCPATALPLP